MARSSVSIAGAMPSCFTWEFLEWANTVLQARLDYCPSARSVTYFVSSSEGDDGNDGLSEGEPLETLAAAQAKLDARSGGDTRIRLKRGDVFRSAANFTTGINAAIRLKDDETVDDYGTGDKPVLIYDPTPATPHVYTSGWTNANTYNKTFAFGTDAESWAASSGSALTLSYNGTDDCLQMLLNTAAAETRHWELTTTWEALGVPAGDTVTNIQANYDWRCTDFTEGDTPPPDLNFTGPFELRNSGGTLQDTFSDELEFSGTTSFATRNGANVSVPGGMQASNTTIKLRLNGTLSAQLGFTPNVILQHDNIVLTITTASGNRYKRTITDDVAWVLKANERIDHPLVRVASAAAVNALTRTTAQAIGGSFWWDSGTNTLHVNIGSDPNSSTLEVVVSNAVQGIAVGGGTTTDGDGARIENIVTYGFGCHRTTTATQAEGIHHESQGETVAIGCESWYCGSHALGMVGGGSGGQWTLIDCTAGYTKWNDAASETVINFFKTSGGHEGWAVRCKAYGTLPSSDWSYTNRSRGQAFFGHCTTGLGFCVAIDCVLPGESTRWPAEYEGTFGDVATPTPGDGTTYGGIRIGTVVENLADTSRTRFGLRAGNNARINGTYYIRPEAGNTQLGVQPHDEIWLGCYIRIDMAALSAAFGLFNTVGGADHDGIIDSCYFELHNVNADFHFNRDSLTATSFDVRNNVLYKVNGSATAFTSIVSGAGAIVTNNAYRNWSSDATRGSGADANAVILGANPTAGQYPSSAVATDLWRAGDTDTLLDYGKGTYSKNHEAPSIGPWQEAVYITPDTFPDGEEGVAYESHFIVEGQEPIAEDFTLTDEPPGLSVSLLGDSHDAGVLNLPHRSHTAILEGTPTLAGVYDPFEISVATADGEHEREFSITIAEGTTNGRTVVVSNGIIRSRARLQAPTSTGQVFDGPEPL